MFNKAVRHKKMRHFEASINCSNKKCPTKQSTRVHTRLLRSINLFSITQFMPRKDAKDLTFFSPFTFHFSRAKAFTLAEVLITLGIIGVIAALTIPNLIAQQQEKATVTALKKAHSVIAEAANYAMLENGPPTTWTQDSLTYLNNFAPYLKITKNCGIGTDSLPNPRCLPGYTYLHTTTLVTWYDETSGIGKLHLADGSFIWFYAFGTCAGESACADIAVDINGFKAPNKWGVDLFQFNFTSTGRVLPTGRDSGFSTTCGDETANGLGCAAWVLYNENLDYVKCPGKLSWDGPTKCP